MSLGFNANRKRQTTNLPGSIGAATIYVRRPPPRPSSLLPRTKPSSRESSSSSSPTLAPPLPPTAPSSFPSRDLLPSVREEERKKKKKSEDDEDHSSSSSSMHWVYATAAKDVRDVQDETRVVCEAGKRALLVYPMTTDPDTGRVQMRCKCVHPVTGQLSYATVLVYDPDTEERPLVDFALC